MSFMTEDFISKFINNMVFNSKISIPVKYSMFNKQKWIEVPVKKKSIWRKIADWFFYIIRLIRYNKKYAN